jgi:hypothetical protein
MPQQPTRHKPRRLPEKQPRRQRCCAGVGGHSPTCLKTAQGTGPPPRGRGRLAFVGLAAAVVVLGVVIYAGIRARVTANATLTRATEQAAIPTVDVVYPKADASTAEIVLPGNTQAFTSAPIYARTSGYLKRWYFDIGAHVKKGQLLARSNRLKSISSCSRDRRISKPRRRT